MIENQAFFNRLGADFAPRCEFTHELRRFPAKLSIETGHWSGIMKAELFDERYLEVSAHASHVGSAWVLAAVVVMFLMTVVAPLLVA